MQSLKKVTSEFIEIEDRFRLSALTTEDEAVAFWLTQRLLTRLVAHLSKQIEIDSPQLSNAPAAGKASHPDPDRDRQISNREPLASQSAVKIKESVTPIPVSYTHLTLPTNREV